MEVVINFVSVHCVEVLVVILTITLLRSVEKAVVRVLAFGVLCYFLFTYVPEFVALVRQLV